jgi:hypothetical protein
LTVRENWVSPNAADTVRGAVIVSWHGVAVQSTPHPLKVEFDPAAAVNVTRVPGAKRSVHSPLAVPPLIVQSMPAGLLVIVPVPPPIPVPATDSVNGAVNVAVTCRAWSIVTVQVPVPLHPAPLHPANALSGSGVAVSVTCVP